MSRTPLTRRSFLAVAGVGGIAAWVTACSNQPFSAPNEERSAGSPFAAPSVLTSRDGRLELTLRAEPTDVSWGPSTRYAYTYNGLCPGPTLRIRPGDRLVVHLENGLDEVTNLHTHGLHVSPTGDADNIFISVPPGGSRTYTYDIPAEHRSGLFWYHPHAHGSVARQVSAGLAGAIVVSDDIDDTLEISDSIERIWILADPTIGTNQNVLNIGPMDLMVGRQGDRVLVNGIDRPDVEAEAGTRERWRFVNASASRYYRLTLDDHPLHVIASDGGRLSAPVTVDEVLLAPGERTEFLVTPTSAGTYRLWARHHDRGGMGMGGEMMGRGNSLQTNDEVIATLTVAGDSQPADLPQSLLDTNAMVLPAPSASRVLQLGMGMGMGGDMMGGDMMGGDMMGGDMMGGDMMGGDMMGGDMMSFTIDGRTFNADRTDIAIARDTVEVWEIRNTSPMDHPLHLHVWAFQVLDSSASPGWKDTVNVPAGGSVRIVIPFTGIIGRTVYHCHILDHEDLGMMGVIDVAP